MAAPTRKRLVKVLENTSSVADALCTFVIDAANRAIKERGCFRVAFSGVLLLLNTKQVWGYMQNTFYRSDTDSN